MKHLIDTNLLLRAVNPKDPQVGLARNAIKALFRQRHIIVIVPQVAYEFWAVATRPLGNNGLGFAAKDAKKAITRWRNAMDLIEDEPGLYAIWLDLVERYAVSGKPAHDARLVAAMMQHKIDRLLTFNDADFKRFTEITALSPLAISSP